MKLDKNSRKMIRDYAKVMFELAYQRCCSHYKMPKDWKPSLKVVFGKEGSQANRNTVVINIDFEDSFKSGYFHFPEYKHIKEDEIIGSFKTKDWRLALKTLIAHELAHSVDHYKDPSVMYRRGYKKSNFDGSHGKTWQKRYKWILTKGFADGKRISTKEHLG